MLLRQIGNHSNSESFECVRTVFSFQHTYLPILFLKYSYCQYYPPKMSDKTNTFQNVKNQTIFKIRKSWNCAQSECEIQEIGHCMWIMKMCNISLPFASSVLSPKILFMWSRNLKVHNLLFVCLLKDFIDWSIFP